MDYDEYQLLEYDKYTHLFIANTDLDEDLQDRVNKMIKVLCINKVKTIRRDYLNDLVEPIIEKRATWDEPEVKQFPTAFEMIKREYQK